MFQQDTVFADSGAGDAAPPSQEQVERAVTKRGRGPPKRRTAPQAQEAAESVRSLATCCSLQAWPLRGPFAK